MARNKIIGFVMIIKGFLSFDLTNNQMLKKLPTDVSVKEIELYLLPVVELLSEVY